MASDSSKVWTVFSLVARLGPPRCPQGPRHVVEGGTGKHPPENPADPDVDIWEAVSWAAVSGAAVAWPGCSPSAGRDLLRRSTGHLPPGLGKDGQ